MPRKEDKFFTAYSIASAILIAVSSVLVISVVHNHTRDHIAENKLQATRKVFNDIIPEGYTNDIFNDVIQMREPDYLGTGQAVNIYRARKNGNPLGVIIHPVIADGYNSAIELGIGISTDGTLTGVRVIRENETEDLGDQVHQGNSNWILMFNGKSYANVPREQWRLKSENGYFDQISGATITSRSVINAVRNTLDLHEIAGDGFYRQ